MSVCLYNSFDLVRVSKNKVKWERETELPGGDSLITYSCMDTS